MTNVLKIEVKGHVMKESPRRSGISRKVIVKNNTEELKYVNKKWNHVA